ncbi:MAG: hypothetical protein ACRC5D_15220 [Aeromonas allosaccharophila]
MLKQQARSAVERFFEVTLTVLAERHPFHFAGVNEGGCVDLFVYYVEPSEDVIALDLATLEHAHGISGVSLKHCILVANLGSTLRYEFFANLVKAKLPILPHHPLGMMMPVMSVPVATMQEIPA